MDFIGRIFRPMPSCIRFDTRDALLMKCTNFLADVESLIFAISPLYIAMVHKASSYEYINNFPFKFNLFNGEFIIYLLSVITVKLHTY